MRHRADALGGGPPRIADRKRPARRAHATHVRFILGLAPSYQELAGRHRAEIRRKKAAEKGYVTEIRREDREMTGSTAKPDTGR